MPTMTTSETVAVHQHKCAKCGEVFSATCGHLVFNDSNPRRVTWRKARPDEYPFQVPACPKPECEEKEF